MKYSNYRIQENEDGTWVALDYHPDTPNKLATANSEDELDILMEKLDIAYEQGRENGIEYHKEIMRKKLGL